MHTFFGNGVTWFDGVFFHNVNSREGLFADRIEATAHDAKERVWLVADDGRAAVYPADFFAARPGRELPDRAEEGPPSLGRPPAEETPAWTGSESGRTDLPAEETPYPAQAPPTPRPGKKPLRSEVVPR